MADRSDSSGKPAEKAQSGIGTLIILIVALLIATTTAGVLFEVTGLLQGETGSASDDAADQLSGQLAVVAATGDVENGTIEVITLTVKTDGSGTVDLRDATIQWVGPSGATTLVWAGSNSSGPSFGATLVNGDGPPVLTRESDRASLVIDPGTAVNATTTIDGRTVDIEETGPALEANTQVDLSLVTESTTTYRILVPVSLEGKSRVNL
jgi:archaellin